MNQHSRPDTTEKQPLTTFMEDYQPHHHTRQSSRQHRQKRMLRRFGLAVTPFVLFLAALTILSYGAIRYIERDSLLAIFLQSRDAQLPDGYHDVNWQGAPTTAPVETSAQTPAVNSRGRLIVPFFYIGDQFGTIRIPSVEINVGVFQGDSEQQFKKGAGKYAGSYYPGQDGNILIAAHRTNYFRNFEYLEVGDLVYIETTYGQFTYQIRELRIIDGGDNSIADPTTAEQLTMYTCYPFVYIGNAPQRFVVICDLIEKQVNT